MFMPFSVRHEHELQARTNPVTSLVECYRIQWTWDCILNKWVNELRFDLCFISYTQFAEYSRWKYDVLLSWRRSALKRNLQMISKSFFSDGITEVSLHKVTWSTEQTAEFSGWLMNFLAYFCSFFLQGCRLKLWFCICYKQLLTLSGFQVSFSASLHVHDFIFDPFTTNNKADLAFTAE